jgi:predicted PurR-regulated permease PerM
MGNPAEDLGESTITLAADDDKSERRFYARLGGVLLLAVLAVLVWLIVAPLWHPLAWALLLGSLLAPLNLRVTARLGGRTQLGSAVTMVAAVLLFILPVVGVLGAVAAQAARLLARLENGMPNLGQLDLANLPWLASMVEWIEANTSVSLAQLHGWTIEGAKRLLQALVASGGSFLMGALGTLASFALMLFVLFFVLRDGPALAQKFVRLLPIEERRRSLLLQHLADVTRAVFLGIGLTALVQGLLVGVGFWIAGLPSPLAFGAVAVLASLIPMVGAALVWAPGALYLAAHGEYGHATVLVAWGSIVVGMADNFLRPMLISGRAEVPTLAVFVGVMGGLSAFGFIGLFLGPIVLGVLVALFRYESDVLSAAHRTLT